MDHIHAPSTSRKRPHIPCRGLCKRNRHYNRVIGLADSVMGAVRLRLYNGLLLTFVNTSRDVVDLIWEDYDGEEIPLIKLATGASIKLSAVLADNFYCRNTQTGRRYLLNMQRRFPACSQRGGAVQTVHITAPRWPRTLRALAIAAVAGRLSGDCDRLELPVSVQADVVRATVPPERRVYYSVNGEPGIHRKSYGERDGPWIVHF